jgi:hypothetical protein
LVQILNKKFGGRILRTRMNLATPSGTRSMYVFSLNYRIPKCPPRKYQEFSALL